MVKILFLKELIKPNMKRQQEFWKPLRWLGPRGLATKSSAGDSDFVLRRLRSTEAEEKVRD